MKHSFNQHTLISLMLLLSAAFCASCSELESEIDIDWDGDIAAIMVPEAVSLECNAVGARNGDTYLQLKPNINADFDLFGINVKQVDYYLDNTLFATRRQAPYTLDTLSSKWKNEQHNVTMRMTLSREGSKDYVLEKTTSFASNVTTYDWSKYGIDYFVDVDRYVEDGHTATATTYLYPESSADGCKFKYVAYYLNDEHVGTIEQAPYSKTFTYHGETNHGYQFRSYVTCSTSEVYHEQRISDCYIYTLASDEVEYSSAVMSSRRDFSSKETLRYLARIYKGSAFDGKAKLLIYWDGEKVEETSDEHYIWQHPLKSEKPGIHEVKARLEVTDSEGKTTTYTHASYYDHIVITE